MGNRWPIPAAVADRPKTTAAVGTSAIVAAALALAMPSLKHDEGKVNAVYLDIVKVPTVCYGHTGADVKMGQARRSDVECERLLESDARVHLNGALKCTPALAEMKPQYLAAVTQLTFNIGVGAYCKSSIARKFNAGDPIGACNAFLLYNRAGGRIVRGLELRRKRERSVCLTGKVAA